MRGIHYTGKNFIPKEFGLRLNATRLQKQIDRNGEYNNLQPNCIRNIVA